MDIAVPQFEPVRFALHKPRLGRSLAKAFGRSNAPAGASFDPGSLPNMLGWWDFSTLGLPDNTAIAGPVTDKSGNGRSLSQATGTLQPLFKTAVQNGLGMAKFDTTDDGLFTGAFNSPTSCSVFIVVKMVTANLNGCLAIHQAAATWTSPFARVGVTLGSPSGTTWSASVEDRGVGSNIITGGTTDTNAHVISFVYDQVNESLWVDGASVATQARSGALTVSNQPFSVGGRVGGGGESSGCQIGEVIYYGDGKNTTDRTSIQNALKAKWATP